MSEVLERQQIAHRAALMRDFRRSDGWGVVLSEIDARRDSLLRRLEDTKEMGLEQVGMIRGQLQALGWARLIPEVLVDKHDRQQREG